MNNLYEKTMNEFLNEIQTEPPCHTRDNPSTTEITTDGPVTIIRCTYACGHTSMTLLGQRALAALKELAKERHDSETR